MGRCPMAKREKTESDFDKKISMDCLIFESRAIARTLHVNLRDADCDAWRGFDKRELDGDDLISLATMLSGKLEALYRMITK